MAMNNSLAEVHPELITEWSEKNLPLTPDDITFGSNKKVTKSSGGKAAVGMNGRPVLRQGQRARNARFAPGREQSQELTI